MEAWVAAAWRTAAMAYGVCLRRRKPGKRLEYTSLFTFDTAPVLRRRCGRLLRTRRTWRRCAMVAFRTPFVSHAADTWRARLTFRPAPTTSGGRLAASLRDHSGFDCYSFAYEHGF